MKGLNNADKELFEIFRSDINNISIPGKEEEREMIKQAQSGDKEAFQRLTMSHIKFVLKLVFKYWNPSVSLMDLLSEGCIGLMVAIKTYRFIGGYELLTYAGTVITNRLIGVIKYNRRHHHISLDEPLFSEDSEIKTRKDLLISDDMSVEQKIFHSDIRKLLNKLTEREKKIILLRYWHELSLDEVGMKIGITKESVRRNENRVLRKLRREFYKERDSLGLENNYVMV